MFRFVALGIFGAALTLFARLIHQAVTIQRPWVTTGHKAWMDNEMILVLFQASS